MDARQRALEQGPEPAYDKIVSGYSVFSHKTPFHVHGGVLPQFQLAYETWGTLNPAKDNVILLHTGLSASSHARSHAKNSNPGWWESFIGPNEPINTDKFFVICTNILGGCFGSTGPSSISEDGKRYATRFPIITVFDMIRAQFKLLDSLGIQKLHASVGSSMGGMQSIAAGAMYPDRVSRIVSISSAVRAHPFSIAMRYAQRQALMMDPNWEKGFYYERVLPHAGMKIGMITYRSGPEWELRFGRRKSDQVTSPSFCAEYLVETYLDHQSDKWYLTYDPNSYLYLSKAMDYFDMSYPLPPDPNLDLNSRALGGNVLQGSCEPLSHSNLKALQDSNPIPNIPDETEKLVRGLSTLQMPALIMGAQSDILFPIWQQKEVASLLKRAGNNGVTYYELDALFGHDTFLIDKVNVGSAVKGHLESY